MGVHNYIIGVLRSGYAKRRTVGHSREEHAQGGGRRAAYPEGIDECAQGFSEKCEQSRGQGTALTDASGGAEYHLCRP